MRGRHVFLDSLRLHGVTKIFGNPGTTETPMLDTLIDYPDIDYIMHLHEVWLWVLQISMHRRPIQPELLTCTWHRAWGMPSV